MTVNSYITVCTPGGDLVKPKHTVAICTYSQFAEFVLFHILLEIVETPLIIPANQTQACLIKGPII